MLPAAWHPLCSQIPSFERMFDKSNWGATPLWCGSADRGHDGEVHRSWPWIQPVCWFIPVSICGLVHPSETTGHCPCPTCNILELERIHKGTSKIIKTDSWDEPSSSVSRGLASAGCFMAPSSFLPLTIPSLWVNPSHRELASTWFKELGNQPRNEVWGVLTTQNVTSN